MSKKWQYLMTRPICPVHPEKVLKFMGDEQIQTSSDELLIEKLRDNVEIACKGDLPARLAAIDVLITELRQSTSSMTSVPRPMKHLIPYITDLANAYENFTNVEYQRKMADLLSLLSIINIDKPGFKYDILRYRIACPIEQIGCWGHEYVRCLTLSLLNAFDNPSDVPAGTDLHPLIAQISKYYMDHNDEPDACDLLLHVGQLKDIEELVDEESHKRVCTYLLQCYNYLPEPQNIEVLDVVEEIFKKLNKTAQAMVIALKKNDQQDIHDIFANCNDEAVKKQLGFLLARQLIVFDDEMDEELTNIATNADLFTRYTEIAERLQRKKPKTPDDVLQLQASLGNSRSNRQDKALSLMAKSFVAAFHNAGLKEDLYYTAPRGDDCIIRNSGNGLSVAVAALAMLNLWDIENGPNYLDKWIHSSDPHIVMGALTGVGIVSAAVRSEFDPALAILNEFLENPNKDIQIGAIFGLAMAYAGSARSDVLELLRTTIENSADFRVTTYAVLAIGLVYVGTCDEEALMLASQPIMDLTDESSNEKLLPLMALGLGLIYLGQQSKCDVAVELLSSLPEQIAKFARITVTSCAYAASGNVLQIQELCRECTGDANISQSAAVLGIAMIAIGDPISCQMARRMFEHILQYGKPEARRMVPIAIALTTVSQPPPEIIDQLHRIGHDTDITVTQNAAIAIGLIAAGTQNSRALNVLHALEQFHKTSPTQMLLLQISEGLVHLGQGLMTLSPTYNDSNLLHPVALGSLLTVSFACIRTEEIIINTDPLLLYFIAPAVGPRYLVTLDENLQFVPIQVRVGSAIDVVGQAGRPRAITGFQTLDTPVILAAGQRAEFVDDTYEPLSPILEGFVIVRKKESAKTE